MSEVPSSYDTRPQAHPGLHAIAVFEAGKGLLALLAASGLEILGPAPLRHWLNELIEHFHFDPDHGALAALSQALNPDSVHLAAALALLYAIIRGIEAWGLWRVRRWASWLGCIGAAIYLPFDLYALYEHPGALSTGVLGVNLLVVWVLARDLVKRQRLAVRTQPTD